MVPNRGTASILAVGTELTTGQITNRNATWISEQLVAIGVEVLHHLTVPDDRPLILQALDWLSSQSQLIFVTGGLGPTTDDFTREVISDWLKKPLQFHEPTWTKIVERLSQFGVPIAESNRNQSYFPESAHILPNPNGTAAGFSVQFGTLPQKIWAFPGPPSELNSVWKQGVNEEIRQLLPSIESVELFTWQCMGKTEAELGEITERVLAGSQLKTGYRAHTPYIEIKVWCPTRLVSEKKNWITQLEEAIRPWIITQQGGDLADELIEQFLLHSQVRISDCATGGTLANRLNSSIRKKLRSEKRLSFVQSQIQIETFWEQDSHEKSSPDDSPSLNIQIGPLQQNGASQLVFSRGKQSQTLEVKPPYFKLEWVERAQAYLTEMIMKQCLEWLKKLR